VPSSGADVRALSLLDDVRWFGAPVTGERTHALLASLASAGSEGASEERLIDEIWGDAVPANPTKALQVVVSRARTATGPDAVVRTPHGYRLGVDSDVAHLRREVAAAHEAERRADWTAAAAAARSVVEATIADSGEGELGALRASARAARDDLTGVLGRALSALGRHEEALAVLDENATDEPTLLALLRSEAAVRGVPAALERYEQVRRRYAERLGVDPGPELQALHAELLARDHPVREGLRYDASRLIGRDDDVSALVAMIRTSRLVSIVGPGGLGKTRLAHLLGRLAEQPTVHFVELVGVTSDEGVAAEVGATLGVRDSVATRGREAVRRADLLDRLVDRIGTAPSLLVLDNCEHVIDAVADLVALLLARTPALTVLTTTRAPLGLAAERVYQLPQLGTDDAIELFRERATAARPGVRLVDEEVRGVVERLDGLPLAVELAAARVRVLSVAEIGRRLEDRFSLLRGGSRDAPERHQTLLAVIDWSWNLLSEVDRTTLRRLSVFRDGFTAESAGLVVDDPDAFEHLASLVDQSLVVVQEDGDELRYRLLETVREFGRDRLAEVGETRATEARLRAWATTLAADVAARVFGPDQVAAMTQVRAEEGNLIDALRGALDDEDVPAVVPLAAALVSCWSVQGAHLRVVTLAEQLEDVLHDAEVAPELENALRGVLVSIVVNSMIFGDHRTDRALARLRLLGPGPDPQLAGVVRVVNTSFSDQVDMASVEALCDDPDPYVARVALQWSCQVSENAGELTKAREYAERGLQLWLPSDGPWGRALTTVQLAALALSDGDIDEAARLAEGALPTLEVLGADEDAMQIRGVFALAELRAGRPEVASALIEEMAAAEGGQSILGGALTVLCGRAEVQLARGELDAGLASYRSGIAALEHRTLPGMQVSAGAGPWVIYPTAAALCAHAYAGRLDESRSLRDALVAGVVRVLDDPHEHHPDFPVVGTCLLGLGVWELHRPGTPRAATAVRLLASAHRFSYNRMLPSLSWERARERAEEVLPGALDPALAALADGRPADHRDAVRRLLDDLG
jgi:predicted ATPase/DNA-binding SARP family transcriptional activator